MRALRLRYVAIGLLTYVQSIGIVVSASASSSSSRSSAAADNSRPSSVSTATAPCRGAGQQADREFSDIPSRTVQAPVAFVGRAKKYRLEAVANGGQDESFSRFRVQFSVVDTYKGQPVLSALSNRQSNDNSSELIVYVDIVVASSQIRRPADGAPTATCSPVSVGSRYVVFASPPPAEARTSSPVRRRSKSKKSSPLVLEAIGLPEPFSERTSKVVKEYSCPKCARQPSTSLPSDDVILLVGQRLRLQCRVAGRPQPVVTWYKNQEVAADRRIKVTKNRGGSQLQIAKVKLEDSGVYSCKGRNVLGTSNVASVNVIVRDQELPTKPHTSLCEDQSYCLNGGTCYVMSALDQLFCECKSNFEGRRCEEKRVGQPVVATETSSSSALLSFLSQLRRSGRLRTPALQVAPPGE